MVKHIFSMLLAAGASTAAAQQRQDPTEPQAKVPAVEHRSAFAGYRAYADPELARWRTVNEEVERIGGHIGILRAQQQNASDSKKKPPVHGEHK